MKIEEQPLSNAYLHSQLSISWKACGGDAIMMSGPNEQRLSRWAGQGRAGCELLAAESY